MVNEHVVVGVQVPKAPCNVTVEEYNKFIDKYVHWVLGAKYEQAELEEKNLEQKLEKDFQKNLTDLENIVGENVMYLNAQYPTNALKPSDALVKCINRLGEEKALKNLHVEKSDEPKYTTGSKLTTMAIDTVQLVQDLQAMANLYQSEQLRDALSTTEPKIKDYLMNLATLSHINEEPQDLTWGELEQVCQQIL